MDPPGARAKPAEAVMAAPSLPSSSGPLRHLEPLSGFPPLLLVPVLDRGPTRPWPSRAGPLSLPGGLPAHRSPGLTAGAEKREPLALPHCSAGLARPKLPKWTPIPVPSLS